MRKSVHVFVCVCVCVVPCTPEHLFWSERNSLLHFCFGRTVCVCVHPLFVLYCIVYYKSVCVCMTRKTDSHSTTRAPKNVLCEAGYWEVNGHLGKWQQLALGSMGKLSQNVPFFSHAPLPQSPPPIPLPLFFFHGGAFRTFFMMYL